MLSRDSGAVLAHKYADQYLIASALQSADPLLSSDVIDLYTKEVEYLAEQGGWVLHSCCGYGFKRCILIEEEQTLLCLLAVSSECFENLLEGNGVVRRAKVKKADA